MSNARLIAFLCFVLGCGDSKDSSGKPCLASNECDGLQCIADPEQAPEDLKPLPLVCGTPTDAATATEACATAEDCTHGICLLAGACSIPCISEEDCEERQRCQLVFARTSPEALQPLDACVDLAHPPDDVIFDTEVREGALSGAEDRIDLVSDGASTMVVLEHTSDTWPDTRMCRPPLCVTRLHDDAGTVLFDVDALGPGEPAPLNPVSHQESVFLPTLLLPYDSRERAEDGYEVTLLSEAPGDLRLTTFIRNEPPEESVELTLDVNLFYSGARDWWPTGDRGPRPLSNALDRVDEIYAQAGIRIGRVNQFAIVGNLPEVGIAFPEGDPGMGLICVETRFGVLVELPWLFRLSAGAPASAINLFLVRSIQPNHERGISGGIPGPLTMHGTGSSGVVIAVGDAGDGPKDEDLGQTIAHEMAHHLGLFHTSEADGRVLDPLADTPECRPEQDDNGNGLDGEECADHGADNLMFFLPTGGIGLSPDQIEFLRGAVVLQ